jgi:hypothetical protein
MNKNIDVSTDSEGPKHKKNHTRNKIPDFFPLFFPILHAMSLPTLVGAGEHERNALALKKDLEKALEPLVCI